MKLSFLLGLLTQVLFRLFVGVLLKLKVVRFLRGVWEKAVLRRKEAEIRSVDDLDSRTLTTVLRKLHPECPRVTSCVAKAMGKAMGHTNSNYRVEITYEGDCCSTKPANTNGAPRSLIIKLNGAKSFGEGIFLAIANTYKRESEIYSIVSHSQNPLDPKLAIGCEIPIPYHTYYNHLTSEMFVLMENLIESGYTPMDSVEGINLNDSLVIAEGLGRMAGVFCDPARLSTMAKGNSLDLLIVALKQFQKKVTPEKIVKFGLSETLLRVLGKWAKNFEKVEHILATHWKRYHTSFVLHQFFQFYL